MKCHICAVIVYQNEQNSNQGNLKEVELVAGSGNKKTIFVIRFLNLLHALK